MLFFCKFLLIVTSWLIVYNHTVSYMLEMWSQCSQKEYFEKYLIRPPLVELVSCFDIIGIGHECLIYDSILFLWKERIVCKVELYSFQNVITKNGWGPCLSQSGWSIRKIIALHMY